MASNNLLDTSRVEDLKQLAFYSKEHSYVCINFINSLFLVQHSVDEEISQVCLKNIEFPVDDHAKMVHVIVVFMKNHLSQV